MDFLAVKRVPKCYFLISLIFAVTISSGILHALCLTFSSQLPCLSDNLPFLEGRH